MEPITEERLAAIRDWRYPKYSTGVHCSRDEASEMARELLLRRQSDRWIPVEEKLPDEDNDGGCALVCNDDGTRVVAFVNERGEWEGDAPRSAGRVTHWRPLPPAPERTEP